MLFLQFGRGERPQVIPLLLIILFLYLSRSTMIINCLAIIGICAINTITLISFHDF